MESRRIQFLSVTLAVCLSVGYAKPPSKIVNGRNAQAGEFPHQVSLQVYKQHICGGSILDARHILTAAHCVLDSTGKVFKSMEVVTGVLDNQGRDAKNVFSVSKIVHHKDYAPKDSWRNDVAMLTLAEPIEFNAYQKPAKLPTRDTPDRASVMASGWGAGVYLGDKSKALRHLQKLSMRVVALKTCQQIMGSEVQSGQICALGAQGSGVCVGDSGGPLTYDDTVIGVASWVIPCGKGYPDIYTRVYHYIPWIKEHLKD